MGLFNHLWSWMCRRVRGDGPRQRRRGAVPAARAAPASASGPPPPMAAPRPPATRPPSSNIHWPCSLALPNPQVFKKVDYNGDGQIEPLEVEVGLHLGAPTLAN
jgi:hypothetical protein